MVGRPRRRSREDCVIPTAALLAERRLALGLTQAELAELAGVGLSSVRSFEAGRTTVGLGIALTILDTLGLAAAIGPAPVLSALPEVAVFGAGEAGTRGA